MKTTRYDDAACNYAQRWCQEGLYSHSYLPFKRAIESIESTVFKELRQGLKQRLHGRRVVTVLDLGCGEGRWLPFLFSWFDIRSAAYFGVDCSFQALRNHSLKNQSWKSVQLIQMDFNTHIPMIRSDVVLALNSLYGMKRKTLAQLLEMIGDGGVLAILMNSREGVLGSLGTTSQDLLLSAEDVEALLSKAKCDYAVKSIETPTCVFSDEQAKAVAGYFAALLGQDVDSSPLRDCTQDIERLIFVHL